jgi:hypothetical protein
MANINMYCQIEDVDLKIPVKNYELVPIFNSTAPQEGEFFLKVVPDEDAEDYPEILKHPHNTTKTSAILYNWDTGEAFSANMIRRIRAWVSDGYFFERIPYEPYKITDFLSLDKLNPSFHGLS